MVVFILFNLLLSTVSGSPVAQDTDSHEAIRTSHLITDLPGVGEMPDHFRMYAGHLEAGHPSKKMYYWLNEADGRGEDIKNKTLIVWLNGGPGCSSLYGLLRENGPYRLSEEDGSIRRNRFSWNRIAHTLYIEAPFGVGFSEHRANKHYHSNDHNVATHLLLALQDFFEIHPRYKDFDLYLSGESYAGIYIPPLAKRIIKMGGEAEKNFKGIILGNPYLKEDLDKMTFPAYAYHHGFMSKREYSLYDNDQYYDCFNHTKFMPGDIDMILHCEELKRRQDDYYHNLDINRYNWKTNCWKNRNGERPEGVAAELECESDKFLEKYLNKAKVQEAIHANFSDTKWKACRYVRYMDRFSDMSSRIKSLVRKHKKTVLLYYGDLDMVCSFLSGEQFMEDLDMRVSTEHSPIYIREGNLESVAGYETTYERLLKFAVIRDAGHMVPLDKPREMYTILRRWLEADHLVTNTTSN